MGECGPLPLGRWYMCTVPNPGMLVSNIKGYRNSIIVTPLVSFLFLSFLIPWNFINCRAESEATNRTIITYVDSAERWRACVFISIRQSTSLRLVYWHFGGSMQSHWRSHSHHRYSSLKHTTSGIYALQLHTQILRSAVCPSIPVRLFLRAIHVCTSLLVYTSCQCCICLIAVLYFAFIHQLCVQ